jgi:pimeloyl-ACP methyl ester carboxylesterase
MILRIVLLISLTLVIVTFALSAFAYTTLTRTSSDCNAQQGYTPADFDVPMLDVSAYLMADYQPVDFRSRDENILISGYFVPSGEGYLNAATVIIVHGIARCKESPDSLLPAGMLHRGGFNVLLIDLRDHGASTFEDGYHAAGTDEYLDVLGAWDWLITEMNIPAEHIGIFGYSLGAASAILAAAEEPQIAAMWVDSAFADIEMIIDEMLVAYPYFGWLKPFSLAYGRVALGDNLLSQKPLDALAAFDHRPLFIVHGEADTIVPIAHAYALRESYPEAEFWAPARTGHVGAMFTHTREYEERLLRFFNTSLID